MLKKTMLAAAVTLAFASAVPSAQAGTLTSMLSGLFDGNGATTTNFEARRGGFRSSRSARRSSSSSSSSRAVVPANRNTSTTANNTTTNTNRSTTNNTNANNQQDAQFSQNAYRGNTTTGTGTVGNNMATTRPGYTQGTMGAAPGSMGMGSTFLSSLAGAGAGVLLANMLLSPSAAAAQGTEQATPDMLSDQQISECLDQLKLDLADAESRLLAAPDEEKAAIRDEISQMHNLQISLMSEQLNRLKGTSEAEASAAS